MRCPGHFDRTELPFLPAPKARVYMDGRLLPLFLSPLPRMPPQQTPLIHFPACRQQLQAPYGDILLRNDAPKSLPLAPPPFTLSDIKNAVPRHCFERSLSTSLFHLTIDLIQVAILGYLASLLGHSDVPPMSRYILWPLYWYAQGSVLTGVWVIAHECGHQSFSPYESVNNFFGWLLHSALLVPYHSWRISHGKHHNNTGSCENDEVFAPPIKEELMDEILLHSPLANLVQIIIMLTIGWMPGYLLLNATGPRKYKGLSNSHFNPNSALFSPKDRLDIIWSDIGFFVALACVVYACVQFGFQTVGKYYLLPYMVVNYHLVLITYLQHTDVFIPHFRGSEWTWFRGALCTVDRSFGWLLDHTFHHISDTHVCHHIFSKMPFYHAQEASEHIRKALGDYYLKDDTPIWKALWRSYTLCKYVDSEETTVFYKQRA